MLFDSHVHFDSARGGHGIAALVERAVEAGVGTMLAVGGSPVLNRHAVMAARCLPGTVWAAIGWDRDQAVEPERLDLARDPESMLRHWSRRIARCRKLGIRVSAMGEMGLDYHYSKDTAPAQRCLFRAQLAAARALDLPVIVHTREAETDTLSLLEEHHAASDGTKAGVVHCFTGTTEFAQRLLALDFFIGFSGIVTFANALALRKTAAAIPSENLLIETDTPYLAPVPHRGRRNEPSFLPAIVQCLAELRNESPEHLAKTTHANATTLFA